MQLHFFCLHGDAAVSPSSDEGVSGLTPNPSRSEAPTDWWQRFGAVEERGGGAMHGKSETC